MSSSVAKPVSKSSIASAFLIEIASPIARVLAEANILEMIEEVSGYYPIITLLASVIPLFVSSLGASDSNLGKPSRSSKVVKR